MPPENPNLSKTIEVPIKQRLPDCYPIQVKDATDGQPDIIWVVRNLNGANLLPDGVRAIQLVRQNAANAEVIDTILWYVDQKIIPLEYIQIPPSLVRVLTPKSKAKLAKQNIEIRIGAINPGKGIKKNLVSENKKEQLKLAFEDDRNLDIFYRLLRSGFSEAEMALQYVYSEKQVTLKEIASQYGITFSEAQRLINGVMNYFEIKPLSRQTHVIMAARALPVWLARQEREAAFMADRWSYYVNDQVPSETLPINRWKTWMQIQKIIADDPDRLATLTTLQKEALFVFYQIGKLPFVNLSTFGRNNGFSPENARQLKNAALKKLGLFTKKQETKPVVIS